VEDLSCLPSFHLLRAWFVDRLQLDRRELAPGGGRNARSILKKQFADGVYIAAAYNSTKVGHCFVLLVIQMEVFAVDNDRAVPLKIYGLWIDQIAFVRKAGVFKQPVKN
jgi:hypothetical protein